jgi:UDP-glucuronate decarboxylase
MTENTTPIRKSALAPTVLVAGGAGFIGSHLVEALLVNGARVVVLDNFSTGKKAHLSTLLDNPKFSLVEWDINNGIPQNVEAVDYVFHLAGLESYVYGDQKITLDSLLTNAIGTKNLLELAKRSYAKFILVSSVDVYQGSISSMDLDHYFGKTQAEENIFSQIEAKRYAEALVWEYHKKHRINARIARLCEVYGPRMDFTSGGELGRMTKLLLDHQDLLVYGDGLEKNHYLFVSDVISGLVKAVFNDDTDGKIFTFS